MTDKLSSLSHRLLVDKQRWQRLKALPEHPVVRRAANMLDGAAELWSTDFEISVDQTTHNWQLIRARQTQKRVVSLLVQYGRTDEQRFRDAALEYIRIMADWEYWSWIMWRADNPDPNAIFDLSYGENSLTLALAYDWLAAELTETEQSLIVDTARQRALIPYLAKNGTPGEESWYYNKPDCNWNTVCNGGAGTLALALSDACPESARVLELVEEGVRHYFEFMQEDGAWPEGIGYWGYGHRYGYYYLLSHESATGRMHPLLERPGSHNTLRFPMLFSPNGVPASFGDANNFHPQPFHYAAADRCGMQVVLGELDRRFNRLVNKNSNDGDPKNCDEANWWPVLAELLLFHPGRTFTQKTDCSWPHVSIQKGLEWSYLTDHWPTPSLYASVRGGTTKAPHTHQDLTSVTIIIGKEALIAPISTREYIDTTFYDGRRFELYENIAASKNVFMVNGVGLPQPATIETRQIAGNGWEGVVLDGIEAAVFGTPVEVFGRAVLMLEKRALLILDRVTLRNPGQAEARFHSEHHVEASKDSAWIQGAAERAHMAFAASVPAIFLQGMGLPTCYEQKPETVIRWMTRGRFRDIVLATLVTPGGEGHVAIDQSQRLVEAKGHGFTSILQYPEHGLTIVQPSSPPQILRSSTDEN
ncbi:MAG: hypothetical protein K9N49_01240 [Candidatus Marinimicrobia bacterium]|nr:hypothetical protein [Candidatus Neomarinimicrobiota bacterium]